MSSEKGEEIVLKVTNLSKEFATGKRLFFKTKGTPFLALNNVSFEVKKGQILGIIGHNGAGKSTLLNILAEVIAPTRGTIEYTGTILSILDIGTGFHPDLSGYKNIFLNGSVLGMKKQNTAQKVDDIIAFSGLAEHIHEPVKNYSNGMYLRLALSIALFTDNDILLLDEVLSVGDIEFRHKAIQQVKAQAKTGKTCVMISHDLGAVTDICDECLLMEKGTIIDRGKPKAMVEKYYNVFYNQLKDQYPVVLDHPMCRLISVTVEKSPVSRGEPVLINIEYEAKERFDFRFFLRVKSFHTNVLTASTAFDPAANTKPTEPGTYQTCCQIPAELLNEGTYLIDVIVGSEEEIFIEYKDACRVKVLLYEWEKNKSWNASLNLFPIRPNCIWTTKQLSNAMTSSKTGCHPPIGS